MGYWLIPGAISLAAFALGRLTHERRWVNVWLLLATVAVMALFGRFALDMHEPDVSSGRTILGFLIAVLALGALPVLGYYALGRVADVMWVALALWVIGLIPLMLYMVFGWLTVADLVACMPGDYECPI